jgi:chromatin remodeling complex protein RSC6
LENGGIKLNDSNSHDLKTINLCDSDESDGDLDKVSQCSHDSFEHSLKNEGGQNEFVEGEKKMVKSNLPNSVSEIESTEKNEDDKIPQVLHDSLNEEKNDSCKQIPSIIEGWASKELKTFLENMKEDTNKPLTKFAVHKLLWMYIKKHKLQNPRKMSDIICDKQLRLIFEKESVGQFEMFKLLNKHFPKKAFSKCFKKTIITIEKQNFEDTSSQDIINQDKSKSNATKVKRKGRKTNELFQRPNSDEYAAINYKNISLIYLRRSILEEFIVDPNFESKVIGTFIKIRVPGNSKMDSCYRLVLVTGN